MLHSQVPLRCLDSDSPGFIGTRKAARRFSWSKCQGNGTEDDHMLQTDYNSCPSEEPTDTLWFEIKTTTDNCS